MSFPRKRESININRFWIPAFAGMTDFELTLGFKAIVLQSGEDLWHNEETLIEIVERIRQKCSVLLILSIGEREIEIYK